MITRTTLVLPGVLVVYGCGDSNSGTAGSGGDTAAGGSGGEGGREVPPLEALAVELGCPIFDARGLDRRAEHEARLKEGEANE